MAELDIFRFGDATAMSHGMCIFMLPFSLHSPTGFAPDAMGRKAGLVFVLFFPIISSMM